MSEAQQRSDAAAFLKQDWPQAWPTIWKTLPTSLKQLIAQTVSDHGDAVRWQQALQQLIEVETTSDLHRLPIPADLQLPSSATQSKSRLQTNAPIGIHGPLEPAQEQALEIALRQLHPWRKGPWWLHNLHLDTEWRSDWKWQRLQGHLPNLLDQRVLDVGSGNGYYGWQMLNAGAAEVVGIDPTVLFVFQHFAAAHLLADLYPAASNTVLPLRLEDLPSAQTSDTDGGMTPFDTVFSMGVLYHRRDHMSHLRQLTDQLRPGGTLVLETLVCESVDLRPQGRYARMRNVHLVPKPETISGWLKNLGFEHCEPCDVSPTLVAEQRSTDWMTFESLSEALDDEDHTLTVEGHPAPVRASFVANWSP